jgi:hypothetical protein
MRRDDHVQAVRHELRRLLREVRRGDRVALAGDQQHGRVRTDRLVGVRPYLAPRPDLADGLLLADAVIGEIRPPGWLYLNLNDTVGSASYPAPGSRAAQAWVTTLMDADGRFSVGYDAVQLDSACKPNTVVFFP